jgi:hypothetical protein
LWPAAIEVSDSEIRKVKAGSAAAKFGDLGDEFFVIEFGSQNFSLPKRGF